LEREARRRKLSLSAVLDLEATAWLNKTCRASESEEEFQRRLHASAANAIGSFAGGDSARSSNAREIVRERLRKQHDR
jgi:hypothetical protein